MVYLALTAYYIHKLVIIYAPSEDHFQYASAMELLTAYGAMGLFCFALTVINAVLCLLDFGSGLKPYLKDYEEGWQPARESLRSIPFQHAHYTQYARSRERDLDS